MKEHSSLRRAPSALCAKTGIQSDNSSHSQNNTKKINRKKTTDCLNTSPMWK